MSLKLMVKKLRIAANAIEDLFGMELTADVKEVIAEHKIRKSVRANGHKRSYKKNGKHWTQTSAGKAKLKQLAKSKWTDEMRARQSKLIKQRIKAKKLEIN